MVAALIENWWMLALRGLAAVIFGILAFIWPELTVTVLVVLFGIYAIWDGIFALISAFRRRATDRNWWLTLLEGVVSVIAGLVAFFYPGITALVLLYVIAAWAAITGIFEIIAAIRLRREIEGEWLLGLSGVASLVFGVLLFLFPGEGAIAVVWIIASYAVLFGILLIVLAFRLRGLRA